MIFQVLKKVVISKTGNVLGNIQSPRVTLEDGAKFKGSIEMDPDEKTQSELPVTSASGSNARSVETVRADKKSFVKIRFLDMQHLLRRW